MTAPIKGCPQPDAPELVMRADGYHYRTEDEMKELTNDDLVNLWIRRMNLHRGDLIPQLHDFARAAIAADRALNAADRDVPAEEGDSICQEIDGCPTEKAVLQRFWREHQSTGTPVAWLLTDKNINRTQVESVQRLIDRARVAHYTDLIIRVNGKDEHYQADWLKHLTRAIQPSNHSADRDVMRQAPEGWKLVPIEPTKAMVSAAQWEDGEVTAMAVWRQMIAEAPTPPAEQPGEQEPGPIAYKRSEFTKNWTTFNVRREHADAAEARLRAPSLSALRAKMEALPIHRFDVRGADMIYRNAVLAEIDKLGGGA